MYRQRPEAGQSPQHRIQIPRRLVQRSMPDAHGRKVTSEIDIQTQVESTVYPGAKRPRTFSPFTGLKDWRALAGPEDNAMTDRSAELERNRRRLGRIEFEMMTATLWVLAGAVIALFFLS